MDGWMRRGLFGWIKESGGKLEKWDTKWLDG